MANTILTVNAITEEALQILRSNLLFSGFSISLDVWDGDSYFRCQRFEVHAFLHNEMLAVFICGKCTKGRIYAAGDVCPECWSVATERPKIGDTLTIRRPMRFTVTSGAAI